jgi:hypothetical protein
LLCARIPGVAYKWLYTSQYLREASVKELRRFQEKYTPLLLTLLLTAMPLCHSSLRDCLSVSAAIVLRGHCKSKAIRNREISSDAADSLNGQNSQVFVP